jgi:hypothetical protein
MYGMNFHNMPLAGVKNYPTDWRYRAQHIAAIMVQATRVVVAWRRPSDVCTLPAVSRNDFTFYRPRNSLVIFRFGDLSIASNERRHILATILENQIATTLLVDHNDLAISQPRFHPDVAAICAQVQPPGVSSGPVSSLVRAHGAVMISH